MGGKHDFERTADENASTAEENTATALIRWESEEKRSNSDISRDSSEDNVSQSDFSADLAAHIQSFKLSELFTQDVQYIFLDLTGFYKLTLQELERLDSSLLMDGYNIPKFSVDVVNKKLRFWPCYFFRAKKNSLTSSLHPLPEKIKCNQPLNTFNLDLTLKENEQERVRWHICLFLRYCKTVFPGQLSKHFQVQSIAQKYPSGSLRLSKRSFTIRAENSSDDVHLQSLLGNRPKLPEKALVWAEMLPPSTLDSLITIIDLVIEADDSTTQLRRFELLLSWLLEHEIAQMYNTLLMVHSTYEMLFQLKMARARCQGMKDFYASVLTGLLGAMISLSSLMSGVISGWWFKS